MIGVVLKRTAFLASAESDWTSLSELTSILLKHVKFLSAMSVMSNVALREGSSKQGNALLAEVGSICVVAMKALLPSSLI